MPMQGGISLDMQDVLSALGREAVMENAQWLILRRNRPVELLLQ